MRPHSSWPQPAASFAASAGERRVTVCSRPRRISAISLMSFPISSWPKASKLWASTTRWLGGSTLAAKRLELLHELAPTATIIALLVNPNNPAVEAETREVKEAARSLSLQVDVLNANTEPDINLAYARLVSQRVGALLVATDLFFASRRDQLVTLAERHVLPTMYSHRDFADA